MQRMQSMSEGFKRGAKYVTPPLGSPVRIEVYWLPVVVLRTRLDLIHRQNFINYCPRDRVTSSNDMLSSLSFPSLHKHGQHLNFGYTQGPFASE